MDTKRLHTGFVLAIALLVGTIPAAAQEDGIRVVPTNHAVLSGYGTAGYVYQTTGENNNAFTASMNPIFLWQFMDDVLFEAEFEFELEGGVTETGLEYAQLDWLVHDNVTLVAGKFILPFGVFWDRLHPTWINKFVTGPPIYGHHVSAFGSPPLMSITSDVGVMARAAVNPGNFAIALNTYLTQGPSIHEEGTVPELEFPGSSEDNNADKLYGGRLDIALPPWAELNVSFMNGDYDEAGVFDFAAWNVAGEVRFANFEMRGEYVETLQEIETTSGFPTIRRHGFYAQAAYRWRALEPVARWTQVFSTKQDGIPIQNDGAKQAAFGINYWLSPSIAMMVGYELNKESGFELDNDRLVAHLAFGF